MMDTYQTGRVPKKSYCLQRSDKGKKNGGRKKKNHQDIKRYKRKDVSNRKRGNTTVTESSALTCLIRGNLECVCVLKRVRKEERDRASERLYLWK